MAGESAREQARRQREKAARLIESADRWDRGANGEVAVASALDELEGSGWTILHDLAWPGRKYANIDHVAIGGGRVFVIDAKNWTGEVAATGGVLRQNGRTRAKEVAAVADAARAVADAVPGLAVAKVQPVLCLVRDDWFAERFGEVLVCSSHNLVAQLRAGTASNPNDAYQPHRVADIRAALQAYGSVARSRHSRGRQRSDRRRHRDSMVGTAVKFGVVIAAMAVLLSQPAWFTAALQRGSEGFVSLISQTTSEPAPVKTPTPVKDRQRNKQETGKAK